MQKMSDPAPEACPACGKGPVVKLVSRTAFILKGGGWYVTDFRDKGKKPEAKKDGGDSAPASGSTASSDKPAETSGSTEKSDAKPAATGGESKPAAPSSGS
jgi:predicted nucleic acid-binding Zn ribbon protein